MLDKNRLRELVQEAQDKFAKPFTFVEGSALMDVLEQAYNEGEDAVRCLLDPVSKKLAESLFPNTPQGEAVPEAPAPEIRSYMKLYLAFGEEKTLKGWSKDSRCQVQYSTLGYRMRMTGNKAWEIENAILTPPKMHRLLTEHLIEEVHRDFHVNNLNVLAIATQRKLPRTLVYGICSGKTYTYITENLAERRT